MSNKQHLLVEGKNDLFVIKALCTKFDVKETFKVKPHDGLDDLLKQLPILLKNKPKTVGIIVDADQDLEARWRSLEGLLSPLGYDLPSQPHKDGTQIYRNNQTTIGIWIMPNNQITGMLEDFIRFLVPEDDKLLPKAEAVLNELQEAEIGKFKSIHHSKALIHTWLAWQEDPGTPLGLAITKKYLTTDLEICRVFVDWLNNLFNPQN